MYICICEVNKVLSICENNSYINFIILMSFTVYSDLQSYLKKLAFSNTYRLTEFFI